MRCRFVPVAPLPRKFTATRRATIAVGRNYDSTRIVLSMMMRDVDDELIRFMMVMLVYDGKYDQS